MCKHDTPSLTKYLITKQIILTTKNTFSHTDIGPIILFHTALLLATHTSVFSLSPN